MKKKITFLKTLLVAAGLLVGSDGAWADNVYTILYGTPTYDTDGTTVIGVTPQTDFTSDDGNIASDITHSDANGANCTNAMPIGGSVLYSQYNFTHNFTTAVTKGTVHFEANYTSTTANGQTWQIVDSNGTEIWGSSDAGKNNGNGNQNIGFCNNVSLGTNWYRQARSCHHRVVLDINLSTKTVSYTILASSGNNSYSTLTGTYNLPDGVSDVYGFKGNRQSSGNYTSYMDNVSFYNVYDDAVTEYAYTINYQLNGTTVGQVYGAGEAGATVNAEAYIWKNDVKYYATDDTEFTIEAGTNTFNVAVREAETYSYTVNAIDASENILKELATGSVYEDESVTTSLPWYVLYNGTLYNQGLNSNTTAITSNNQVVNITYTATANTGVVYYTEGENISGGTWITHASCSNGAAARALTSAKFTTIEAGKYKVVARFVVGNGTAGETYASNPITVGTTALEYAVPARTNTTYTSEEFCVTESTDLYVTFAGSSISGVDYIYVQKTGDVQTLTSTAQLAGYKTFYNATKSFKVDASTTIYKAGQVSGDYVVVTAVAGKVIPAGTPVILKTTAADYKITLTETATAITDEFSDNALQAAEADGTKSGAYILAYTEDNGFGFYKFTGSLEAGDVYVTAAAAGAKLRITFATDDATGIQAIASEEAEGAIYNVAGQQVNAAYKGIVIKNGKKYLNK